MADPYTVLGVPRDATEDTIKTAFRKLAMEFHPDRNPGNKDAEEKFKEVSAAYEQLTKPQANQGSGPQGFSHRQAPNGSWFEFSTDGNGGFNMDDFFNQFDMRRRPQRNGDVIGNVVLTLEQVFSGHEVELSVQDPNGTRYVKVQVPPGVDHGTRLRVAGAGERRIPNVPAGDLYVQVYVQQHAIFQRRAQNLFVEVKIDMFDAILGTEIEIPIITGQAIKVKVPAGSQIGQQLRVANHGMPVTGLGQRGDLFVVLNVTTPTNLTDEQKTLLQQARDLGKTGQ